MPVSPGQTNFAIYAPIVTLIFKRMNGTTRSARLVFDSGSGAIIFDESLANDLALKPTGEAITDGGMRYLSTNSPVAHSGSCAKAFCQEEEEAMSMLDIIDDPHRNFLFGRCCRACGRGGCNRLRWIYFFSA